MRNTLLLTMALTALACASPTEVDDRWAIPENINFAPSLNINLPMMEKTASGLYWQDLVEGTGAGATYAERIAIHHTGWLPDGFMFETTRPDRFIEFQLGLEPAIPGWEEGITGMKVGGRRLLVLRPELAFGEKGKGSVPPRTTVVYEIERVPLPAR